MSLSHIHRHYVLYILNWLIWLWKLTSPQICHLQAGDPEIANVSVSETFVSDHSRWLGRRNSLFGGKVKWKLLSHVQLLLVTLWTSVHGLLQAGKLEWVAISFSRGSSQPRDWTWVSCIAGSLCIIWATREACGVREANLLVLFWLSPDWRGKISLPIQLLVSSRNTFRETTGIAFWPNIWAPCGSVKLVHKINHDFFFYKW